MSKVIYIANGRNALLRPEYVREMAATALQLLEVDGSRRNLTLLLGYPVSMTNQKMIESWIANYVLDQQHVGDFRDDILPALEKELTRAYIDHQLLVNLNF